MLNLHGELVGDVVYAPQPGFDGAHGKQLPSTTFSIGGQHSTFILAGGGVRRGIALRRQVRAVDVAPTLAYLLGLPMPADVEGGVVYEALDDFEGKNGARLRRLRQPAAGGTPAGWRPAGRLWRGGLVSVGDFAEYLRAAFDCLYAESQAVPRMISIGRHCRTAGTPARSRAVADFLENARGFAGVWFVRRIHIARSWLAHHPTDQPGAAPWVFR
jgi:hypothetical protein